MEMNLKYSTTLNERGSKMTSTGEPSKDLKMNVPVAYVECKDDRCLCDGEGPGQVGVVTNDRLTVPADLQLACGDCCVQESADAQMTPSECSSQATRTSVCNYRSVKGGPSPSNRGSRRLVPPFVLPCYDSAFAQHHEGLEPSASAYLPSSPVEASTAASSHRESCRQFPSSAAASMDLPHTDATLVSSLRPKETGKADGHTNERSDCLDTEEAVSPKAERMLLGTPVPNPDDGSGTAADSPRHSLTELKSFLPGEGDPLMKTHVSHFEDPTYESKPGRHNGRASTGVTRESSSLSYSVGTGTVDTTHSCVPPDQGVLATKPLPQGCPFPPMLVPDGSGAEAARPRIRRQGLVDGRGPSRCRSTKEFERGGKKPTEKERLHSLGASDVAKLRRASLPDFRASAYDKRTTVGNPEHAHRSISPLVLSRKKTVLDSNLRSTWPCGKKDSDPPQSGNWQNGMLPPLRGHAHSEAVSSRMTSLKSNSSSCVEFGKPVQCCPKCRSQMGVTAVSIENRGRSETICWSCWRSKEISLWKQLTDWRASINCMHFLSLQKHYKYQLPNQEDSAAFSIHNKAEKRIFFVVSHTHEPAAAYLPSGWHMSLYLPNPAIHRDVLDVVDPKSTEAFTVIRADMPSGQSLFSYVSRPYITVSELVHCGEYRTTRQEVLGYISAPRSPSAVVRIHNAKRNKIIDIVRRTKGCKNRRLPQEWVGYRQNKRIAVKLTLFLDEYNSIAGRDATIHYDESVKPTTKMLAIVSLCYIQLLSFGHCAGAEI